jgi:low temperature requirement protein LtrA
MRERWLGLLRDRGAGGTPVTPIELFFDLVYALAITQLTDHLLHDLTLAGAGRSLLLLLAVWWTWNYAAWFTNYFNPDKLAIRIVLVTLMLASLVMSSSLPAAFGDHGLAFAIAYVAIQILRTLFAVTVLGRHALGPVFQRALVWWSGTSILWLAGGLLPGDSRAALWTAAMVIDGLAVVVGFPVPGLGRSRTIDYTISGEHMAERCRLFVLLALGESILVTGRHFVDVLHSPAGIAAFVTAFIGSVALWAAYFNWDAEAGRRAIAVAADPGKLGVSAFSYFHVPILAGIVVFAAAAELTITHPSGAATVVSTALVLGGPALFLAGSALYGWSIDGRPPTHRLAGLGALAILIPVAFVSSQLILSIAASSVVLGVAIWDMLALKVKPFGASS